MKKRKKYSEFLLMFLILWVFSPKSKFCLKFFAKGISNLVYTTFSVINYDFSTALVKQFVEITRQKKNLTSNLTV